MESAGMQVLRSSLVAAVLVAAPAVAAPAPTCKLDEPPKARELLALVPKAEAARLDEPQVTAVELDGQR